jgi:TonB family protein
MSYNYEIVLLPERKIDRRFVAVGYGFLALVIAAMTFAPLVFTERLNLTNYYSHVTELIPPAQLRPEPPPPPVELKPIPAVKIEIPAPVLEEASKIVLRRDALIQKPELEKAPEVVVKPMPAPEFKFAAVVPRAPRIVQAVDLGGSAQPTLKPSVQSIQTGGFGDPNGIAGTGKPNARLTLANTGAFDSSPGSGNKSSTGQHGTVASGGFGSEVAQAAPSHATGQLQTGGFGTQAVAQGSAPKKRVDAGSASSEVQITFKPTPAYTAEARQLRIEGEVLLEVMFGGNSQLHVNRVVRGLGHGLDESAITATKQMQYKPALNKGEPVDSTAIVHVTFQLAY